MAEGMGSEGYTVVCQQITRAPAVREAVCQRRELERNTDLGSLCLKGAHRLVGGGHKVQEAAQSRRSGREGKKQQKRCLVSSEVQPTPEPWTPGSMADFMSGQ